MDNQILSFKRIVNTGVKNFIRNGWLSIATTSIMTLTLLLVGAFLFATILMNQTVYFLENRLNISVYFNVDVSETEVLKVKNYLDSKDEIKETEFVSKEKGMANLLDSDNIDDREVLQQAVEEIGDNPLMHTLNVQSYTTEQYESIVEDLENGEYKDIISRVKVKKDFIDKVHQYSSFIKYGGISLSFVFALISILITYNAIRITIHNFKNEIEVMKLVGASHWYIKSPFIVEGVLYGSVACLVTIIVIYPIINILSKKITSFMEEFDVAKHFNDNFIWIFLFLFLLGIIIGGFSSWLAIRKYLKEELEPSKKNKKNKKKVNKG